MPTTTAIRSLYSRRIATVEPAFAKLSHNKRLARFSLRGAAKVRAQWQLFCLVHNIEKLAHRADGGHEGAGRSREVPYQQVPRTLTNTQS